MLALDEQKQVLSFSKGWRGLGRLGQGAGSSWWSVTFPCGRKKRWGKQLELGDRRLRQQGLQIKQEVDRGGCAHPSSWSVDEISESPEEGLDQGPRHSRPDHLSFSRPRLTPEPRSSHQGTFLGLDTAAPARPLSSPGSGAGGSVTWCESRGSVLLLCLSPATPESHQPGLQEKLRASRDQRGPTILLFYFECLHDRRTPSSSPLSLPLPIVPEPVTPTFTFSTWPLKNFHFEDLN